MIIYGTKATHLKTHALTGACKNCQTENSMIISAYQKYAHVFWIPVFPLSKIYATQCNHCKQVLEEKEVKSTYRTAYEDLKNTLRTPVWTFAGLALIGVAVVYGIVSDSNKKDKNLAYLQAPVSGDVYEYKTDGDQYSLMKITDVIGDSVYFYYNKYESNKITGLSKLENQGDTTFLEEAYVIAKSELIKMHTENKILDVIRKDTK